MSPGWSLRPRTMSDRDPALDPFDALVGTWTTASTHPMLPGEVVSGRQTFSWLEGGRFLVQRSQNDHELFPDAICVIGPQEHEDGLVQEYFDSRGVRRTYRTAIENGVWRLWRDAPGFDQRITARLAQDEFDGLCEVAETPGAWRDDLRVTYRRAAPAPR